MITAFHLEVTNAESILSKVNAFYESCGKVTSVSPHDILIVARDGIDIVGVARLSKEEAAYVLRTMQIREDLQGQGLGTLILNRFDKLLTELKISRVYCMPYLHLEYFYGLIGFRKIAAKDAPVFLQNRAKDFHLRNPGKDVILMRLQRAKI